jgi:hypothetical protein
MSKLPIHFPATCIDNFYDDPDSIREFALSQEFSPSPTGAVPGKRTKHLHEIDKKLFDFFCHRLFSIFFDLSSTEINWKVETGFQLVPTYGNDKNSIKNHGWIHEDGDCIFSGVIYLNPKIDPESGTSIYKLIDNSYKDESFDVVTNSSAKSKFYLNGIDDNYDYHLKRNIDAHEETIRFTNQYNRMIIFEGGIPHGVRNSYSGNDELRLTQVFFVTKLQSTSLTPLQRMRVK